MQQEKNPGGKVPSFFRRIRICILLATVALIIACTIFYILLITSDWNAAGLVERGILIALISINGVAVILLYLIVVLPFKVRPDVLRICLLLVSQMGGAITFSLFKQSIPCKQFGSVSTCRLVSDIAIYGTWAVAGLLIILLGCIAFINRTRYHHTQKDIDTIERAEAEQPPVKGTLADGLTDSHEEKEKVDSDFYNAPPSMTIPSSNFGPARSLTLDAAPRFTAALTPLHHRDQTFSPESVQFESAIPSADASWFNSTSTIGTSVHSYGHATEMSEQYNSQAHQIQDETLAQTHYKRDHQFGGIIATTPTSLVPGGLVAAHKRTQSMHNSDGSTHTSEPLPPMPAPSMYRYNTSPFPDPYETPAPSSAPDFRYDTRIPQQRETTPPLFPNISDESSHSEHTNIPDWKKNVLIAAGRPPF